MERRLQHRRTGHWVELVRHRVVPSGYQGDPGDDGGRAWATVRGGRRGGADVDVKGEGAAAAGVGRPVRFVGRAAVGFGARGGVARAAGQHGARFVRWRPDRETGSCMYDQLDVPAAYDLADVFG